MKYPKYIRTKDAIYALDEGSYTVNGENFYSVPHRISTFTEDQIVAKSDDILDLIRPGDIVALFDGRVKFEVYEGYNKEENEIMVWRFVDDNLKTAYVDVRQIREVYVKKDNDYRLVATQDYKDPDNKDYSLVWSAVDLYGVRKEN